MGFRASMPEQHRERELPQIYIKGTLFLVDIEKYEFCEVANPDNRMPFVNVNEVTECSFFFYDTLAKNTYLGNTDKPELLPEHVTTIILQPLKELDPVGLARRHGFRDDHYLKGKDEELKSVVRKSHRVEIAQKKYRGKKM